MIGISEIGELKGQPSVAFKDEVNFNKLVAIFYNTKDPILSDKNMRKALSLSSPKIEGESDAKTSIPAHSWAYNDQLKQLIGDAESAKSYLNKVNVGKDSTITLTTTPMFSQLGERIISSWKQIGINAILRVESGIPQNFQAVLLAEPIPTDPDQYALWHSTQTKTNISKYSSPRVDKDLEDGRKISKLDERQDKYFDFQKVLLDDSPATFLYYPKTNIVFRIKSEDKLNKVLDLQIPKN